MDFRRPTPGAALGLFALAFILNVFLSFLLFQVSPDAGILFAEPVAILLPTLIAVAALRVDGRKTLRLKWPPAQDLLFAFPLAISLAVLSDQLSNLTNQFAPLDEKIVEQMAELLRAETAYQWVIRFLGIGLGAAVAEEFLFRGFMQTALEGRIGRRRAILWTSFLFAIMHFIPQGIPSYLLAGIVLGITAAATESILVPVVIHMVHNMALVTLLSVAGIESLGRPVWIPPGILVPAVLIFILTIVYYGRRVTSLAELPPPPSVPSAPAEFFPSMRAQDRETLTVSDARRRLGWLTVGCAVAIGTAIIVGLFTWSVYLMGSEGIHARLVAQVEEQILSAMSPEDADLEPHVRTEFDALEAAAEAGRLRLSSIFRLTWLHAQNMADGALTRPEVERMLEEARRLAQSSTNLRRL